MNGLYVKIDMYNSVLRSVVGIRVGLCCSCLLYTSDAADEL